MHPSRSLALGFITVSTLLIVQVGLIRRGQLTVGTIFQLIGAVFLLIGGLYGFLRYEENPIITEYGPMAYVFLFGLGLWAVGILLRLVSV